MEFVLNNRVVRLRNCAADTTLLRYIREEAKLRGTKEGCASGDCGACTVIVGELDKNNLNYKTVNACITPLGAMQGKHVITIEHLQKDTRLHPVQQAFVDCHASQCGFCTPGLVMSVTGLLNDSNINVLDNTKEKICDAISGNLCRCTGYRPIIDAGIIALKSEKVPLHSPAERTALQNIQHKKAVEISEGHYLRPFSLKEWSATKLHHNNAPMLAGGTDLVLEISTRYKNMPVIIDISNIEELQTLIVNENHVTIGAGVPYDAIIKKLTNIFPRFTDLLKRIGSAQIRYRGTLGGNIANASPIADTPPVFLALDAQLTIYNVQGSYRKVPLSEFYLGYKQTLLQPNDIIVSVSFPRKKIDQFHRFEKVTKRYEDDISSVMGAFSIVLTKDNIVCDTRIAFGGMAATPVRVISAERSLIGKTINDTQAMLSTIDNIKANLSPISDVRASSQYRIAVAANLFRKAWLEINGENLPAIQQKHHYFSEVAHA